MAVQKKKNNNDGSPIMALFLLILIGGGAFVALNFNKVMNYIETGKYEEPGDVTPVDNSNSNNNSNNNNNNNNNNDNPPVEEPNNDPGKKDPEPDPGTQEPENKKEPKQDTTEDEEVITSILSLLPYDKVFLNDNDGDENGYSGPNDRETTFYISPGDASVKIDQYYTFETVMSKDIETDHIIWECSDTKIVSNEGKGKFRGLKAGTVTITARISNGEKRTATLHVINAGLSMSTSSSIKIGETASIAYDLEYKGKIKFVSSNPKIATVDNEGRITPKRTGTVTITGTYNNLMNSVNITIVGSRIHFINTHSPSDAILLESNSKFALIDTGTTNWESSRKYFFEYLDSLGLKEEGFEFVILTNQHADHSGGMVSLLNKGYPVKRIYMKSYNSNDDHSEKIVERYNTIVETAREYNTSIVYVDKDSKFTEEISKSGTIDMSDMRIYFFNTLQRLDNADKVDFDYFKANYYKGESENINSIVNLVRVNNHNILLTSDLNDYDIFNGVMKNKVKMVWNRNEKIDIYKINNHGRFDCTGNSSVDVNATYYVVTNNIDEEYSDSKGVGYMISNDKVVYNSKENDSCFKKLGKNMCDAYYSNNSEGALIFDLTLSDVKVNGKQGVNASKRCK